MSEQCCAAGNARESVCVRQRRAATEKSKGFLHFMSHVAQADSLASSPKWIMLLSSSLLGMQMIKAQKEVWNITVTKVPK